MTFSHNHPPAWPAAVRMRWSGFGFVMFLLISAGMATVPGGADSVLGVREYYGDDAGVVVTAQVIGMLAAVVFLVFSAALDRSLPGRTAGGVRRAGRGVAAAGVITAVPVLALCAVAQGASDETVHRLAVACDLVDIPLFAAIAWCAVAVSRCFPHSRTSWVMIAVGALAAARAVLLLSKPDLLELAAPLAFVALVVALSLTPRHMRSDARTTTTDTVPAAPSRARWASSRGRSTHATPRRTTSDRPPGEGERAPSPATPKEK